jgi:hypothetical protein
MPKIFDDNLQSIGAFARLNKSGEAGANSIKPRVKTWSLSNDSSAPL